MLDALYYPYFYPPTNWLRRAALCWNTVYRLRTPDALPDSAEIAELDAALGGVLGDLDFHSVYRDVIQEFLDWLDANLERWQRMPRTPDERSPLVGLLPSKFPGGELIDELVNRQVASVETHESERLIPKWELEEWESRFLEAPARAYGPPRRGSAQYRYEELQRKGERASARGDTDRATRLRNKAAELRQRHLVAVSDPREVILLPSNIAQHYLALVARETATERKLAPIAAEPEFTDVVTHSYRLLRGAVAEEVLEFYLPRDIDRLDPARIRDLREQLSHRRRSYQAEIDALIERLMPAGIESERDLESAKRDLITAAREQAEAVQSAYKKARIDAAVVPMGLTLTPPAVFAALGSALGIGLLGPLGVGAAVAVAAQTVRLARGSADAQRAVSPWSYVLDVERELR